MVNLRFDCHFVFLPNERISKTHATTYILLEGENMRTKEEKQEIKDKYAEIKRDNRGRFLVGNPGGPGMPPVTKEWLNIFKSKTAHNFNRLYDECLRQALSGELKAVIYMLDRLLGRQKEEIEITNIQQERNPEELAAEFNKLFRN